MWTQGLELHTTTLTNNNYTTHSNSPPETESHAPPIYTRLTGSFLLYDVTRYSEPLTAHCPMG